MKGFQGPWEAREGGWGEKEGRGKGSGWLPGNRRGVAWLLTVGFIWVTQTRQQVHSACRGGGGAQDGVSPSPRAIRVCLFFFSLGVGRLLPLVHVACEI